jgi:hypothetical protein
MTSTSFTSMPVLVIFFSQGHAQALAQTITAITAAMPAKAAGRIHLEPNIFIPFPLISLAFP